ncbi:ABC transporter related protein [Tsukamurella paurometabola DSM 20162]|uniref:ABC transporter related protein n=2 Tax=Tsukamurella paurometabola TaxID=2061 RepID=D5USZ6_TSUPD|nr:ABC transporter related protein [Tsukamurella paurometabola DSM 20162]
MVRAADVTGLLPPDDGDMHTDHASATLAPPRRTVPVVAFTGVTKSYGTGDATVIALDSVNLAITAGGFTAVMGPSGSGKSTLLNLAAGLDRPTQGEVHLAGSPITAMPDDQLADLRSTRAGFIFQAFNLVQSMTARQNIELPFRLRGAKVTAEDAGWIDYLAETLGITGLLHRRPSAMSGGQQQRVAIARALAARPQVIFADEPTGSLDSRTSREVLGILKSACAEYRQTVVMVTHDPVAASYADRVLVIADGRVAGDYASMPAARIAEMMVGLEGGTR